MIASRNSTLFLVLALAAGCGDHHPTAIPEHALAAARSRGGIDDVTVMTQNLYVGADVDRVIGALLTPDPQDDQRELFFAIETLGKTAFPVRAEAIAAEIARTRPHAVGLQEVSQIDIDLRPLGAPIEVHQDFLAIVQDALARRGLNYQLAAKVRNTDAKLVFGLVSLVDYDALLVDASRVSVVAAGGQNFAARVPPEAVGGINLIRGWVWARTLVSGEPYTFVSLHAESNLAGQSLSALRAAQMLELVSTLPPSETAILMGDFNDDPGSSMYQILTGAGFTDTWATLQAGEVGYTCCHVADLSDAVASFTQRIDYVFTRSATRRTRQLSGEVGRFGAVPADRLAGPAYPIWPSDHAGLVARLDRP